MDAGLQLDEGPIVLQPDDLTDQPLANLVALLDRRRLLVAQGHALGRAVELEHDHVDLVVDLEELRRMRSPAPRHVGQVQQPVEPPEVDERAVVGDGLDHPAEHPALF